MLVYAFSFSVKTSLSLKNIPGREDDAISISRRQGIRLVVVTELRGDSLP
jgi:hypothetical protein